MGGNLFPANSSADAFDVSKLLSMTKSQAKSVADRALCFCNTRDNRTFASVVSSKCGRAFTIVNDHGDAGMSTLFISNTLSPVEYREVPVSTFMQSHKSRGAGVDAVKKQNSIHSIGKQKLG